MRGVRSLLVWVADRPAAFVVLLIVGVAERIAWTLAGHMALLDTELRNAAICWSRTGWIADAFRPGSGPTAHVGALPPAIPGIVFRVFGVETPATSLLLTAISACVVVSTAFVLNRLFARLGTPAAARGAAVLLICVLPLHIEIESRSLRVYENGYAALLLAVLLLAAVRLDQFGRVGTRDMIGLSALAALMIALSPTVGYCAVAILGILALRQLDWAGRAKAALVLSVLLAATITPWAIRNREVMGEAVWTRDNFGLEFAVGTNPAAVAPVDPGETYLARLTQIHPHGNETPYRAMQAAGGEVAYARQLGDQTSAWVREHPAAALTIWMRHLREFYFPPMWMWVHSGPPDITMPARKLIVDLIAVLALVGFVSALARRARQYVYLLPPVVLLPLPYLLTQPLVRYRYVIASLLVFMAADSVARLTRRGQDALKQSV
jgi:hypothetical protein